MGEKRGCVVALINACGNLAGFVGPYTIGAIAQRTGTSYGGLALAGLVMFAAAWLVVRLPIVGARQRA